MNSRYVELFVAMLVLVVCLQTPANALPPFAKAFKAVYFQPSENEDFRTAIRKANCNICHVKGEKKDVNNEYGEKLAESIEGDAKNRWDVAKKVGDVEAKAELEKLVAELNEALGKVAEMENAAGRKFGDILAAGELPVPIPSSDDS